MLNFNLATFLIDYWVNSVIVGSITVVGLILAYAVYKQEKKSVTNQTLAIFFISITFWILFAHLGDSKSLVKYSLQFNRIVYACLYFWAYCLILLPFVFPKDTKIIKLPYRIILLCITFILAAISIFTDKFIATVKIFDWGASNVFGQWGTFFNAYMTLSMLPMIKYFWVYKRSDPDQKRMLKFFFLGLLLFLSLVLIVYLPVNNLVGDERYYRYGNYSAIFFISFTAYAILKHHLFNIRIILTELAVVMINGISAVQLVASKSTVEFMFRLIFQAVILYGSVLLDRSLKNELRQKEELRGLAKRLDEANIHLEELDEEKDNFISMASHELNTPIAAIEGYLSMIIEEKMAGKINPKAVGYLTNVFNSSKRLAALVRDLLNVSRIESHRIHVIYTQAQVEDVIDQAMAEIQMKAKEEGHTLTFEKPKTKLPMTYLDVPRIVEVIINLIGNAIKYTEAPGKIEVTCHADDGKIVVAVEDNGRGIPKDKEEHVFEKFTQVDVLKDQVKGTGLGMFISKNLIELHKGKLWFKSSTDEKDHGTTFYFSLPILKEKPFDEHEGEGALFQSKPNKQEQPVSAKDEISPKDTNNTDGEKDGKKDETPAITEKADDEKSNDKKVDIPTSPTAPTTSITEAEIGSNKQEEKAINSEIEKVSADIKESQEEKPPIEPAKKTI